MFFLFLWPIEDRHQNRRYLNNTRLTYTAAHLTKESSKADSDSLILLNIIKQQWKVIGLMIEIVVQRGNSKDRRENVDNKNDSGGCFVFTIIMQKSDRNRGPSNNRTFTFITDIG